MKKSNLIQLKILIVLIWLLVFVTADFEDLFTKVVSLSTVPDSIQPKYRQVSLEGGALLYIKGSGFSSRSALSNKVTIGTYNCPVIEFLTTTTQVVCQIPSSDQPQSLQVRVFVDDMRVGTCDGCILTYSYLNTPQLMYMLSNAANPGQEVFYYGKQRVESSLDVDYVKIGEHRCDSSEQNEFDSVTFTPNSNMKAPCNVPDIEAGYYNVSQKNLENTGTAKKLNTVPVYNSNGDAYDFTVVPKIDSISNNIGSSEGQIISIQGSGFSTSGQNEVYLANTPCKIFKQSSNNIECELKPVTGAIGDQGYHSGLKFFAYKDKDMASVRSGSAGTPSWTKALLSAEIDSNTDDYYSSKISGFFRPPVTGKYKFVVSADDKAQLYLSKTPLTKTNLDLIVDIQSPTPYRFFYMNGINQISQEISLNAGEYYYMELYHTEFGYNEHATVGVQIPNTFNRVNNVPEVQSLKINCPTDFEIMEFRLTNAKGGQWKIKFEYLSSDRKTIEKTLSTDDISYNAAASAVSYQIFSATGLKNSATRKMLDKDGSVTSNAAEAVTYVYEVEFQYLRKNGKLPVIDTKDLQGSDLEVAVKQLRASSPAVGGTFTFHRNEKSVEVMPDATAEDLEAKLIELGFSDPIKVAQSGDASYGSEWRIQFTGEGAGPVDALLVTHSLTGCKETNLPEVISSSYTKPSLSVSINKVNTGEYKKEDIRVFLGNTECQVTAYSDSSSPVTLNAECPTPEAGEFSPKVHFKNLGYARTSASLSSITINTNILSVTPTQINPNGGSVLTVVGNGFPASLAVAKERQFSVKIGSAACEVSSVTPTQFECLTQPTTVSAPISVALNGKAASSSSSLILLTAVPTISTITPNAVSPVLQTDITITGSNFDSNIASTKVYLSTPENSQVTECLPISSTANEIKCKLLGAPTGTYKVYAKTSFGNTNSLSFDVKTVITSISPSSGSAAGGTILTIQGGTFSNDKQQTLVYIGDESIACDLISSSSSQIQCRVQPRADSYSESPQDVVVATRIVELSQCASQNACHFTYSDSLTPSVTSISTTSVTPGNTLQIVGTGFSSIPSGTAPVVTVDNVICSIVSSSDQAIEVIIPVNAIPNKAASLVINIAGKGNAQFAASGNVIQITPSISSISPSEGSTTGVLVTLNGAGFQNGVIPKIGGQPCEIRSLTSTTIVCKTKLGGDASLDFKDFTNIKCPGSCSLALSSSKTSTITSVSPSSPTSSALFELTVQGTQFDLGTPVVTLISKTDATVLFEGSVTASTATQLKISFTDIAAGSYSVEVACGPNIATSSTTINVPLSASVASPITSSIAGGATLTLTGSGFFESSKKDKNRVSVCGFPCKITQSTSTSLMCQTPLFVNSAVKSAYSNLIEPYLLEGKTWSDSGLEISVFDLAFTTVYKAIAKSGCQVGLDMGENLVAELSEVKFFPNPEIVASTLGGAVIEGSSNNSTYTLIATVDANAHDGWNTINLQSQNSRYRYIRFRGATSNARCSLAELQF